MSLPFLSPAAATTWAGRAPVAASPLEADAEAAGARFEVRGGWRVAASYPGADPAPPVGWVDSSPLPKLEAQAGHDVLTRLLEPEAGRPLELGRAVRGQGAWWCPVTPERTLVLGLGAPARARLEAAASDLGGAVSLVDVTAAHAALTLVGPLAREAFARFCALDLRPASTPVGGFRPGSVARSPGYVLREADDRYLVLFGAALGHYVWTQVADAARHLGGGPLGADALGELPAC